MTQRNMNENDRQQEKIYLETAETDMIGDKSVKQGED